MKAEPSYLFVGGTLVEPSREGPRRADILVRDGKTARIGIGLSAPGSTRVDCKGKFILPGFVDLHAHLREPGREDEETIASGTRAALAGGFVTVLCMPNTTPPVDNEQVVRYIQKKAKTAAQAEVLVVGAISKGLAGRELSEIGALVEAGVVALSDDGRPVMHSGLMRHALEYARMYDLVVISHCEDLGMSAGGIMHEGLTATRLGLVGIPSCAEEAHVMRDILLADYVGARLHIAHVSTRGSVEIIRWAKRRGSAVTAETCPHYLALTDEACANFDTSLRVNPPLRSAADRKALIEGLLDGTIDAIATDHAPHLRAEKEVEFGAAPCGMIGLETAFLVAHEQLVGAGLLDLTGLARKFVTGPAQVLRRPPHRLAVGEEANLVVFNPRLSWTYDSESVLSRSRNSPFLGRRFEGRIESVFHRRLFRF